MNENVKKLWVDTLRSNEYKQGKRNLQCDGTFCCLGVLCELAIKNGVPVKVTNFYETFGGQTYYKYDGSGACLPEVVKAWADFPEDFNEWILIGMNDGETPEDSGKTFAEIADYIEKNL